MMEYEVNQKDIHEAVSYACTSQQDFLKRAELMLRHSQI